MPDGLGIEIDQASMKEILGALEKLGVDINPTLLLATDWAANQIADHMKQDHYFVGTGHGASKAAKEHEFTFKNPDGTPRFKVRTNNLVRSIQVRDGKITSLGPQSTVKVGESYAEDVEFGGPGRRAFPFIRPAAEAIAPRAVTKARELLQKLLRRVGGAS